MRPPRRRYSSVSTANHIFSERRVSTVRPVDVEADQVKAFLLDRALGQIGSGVADHGCGDGCGGGHAPLLSGCVPRQGRGQLRGFLAASGGDRPWLLATMIEAREKVPR